MLEIRKKLLHRAIPPAPFEDIKPISSLRRQNFHLNAYFTFVVVIAGSSMRRKIRNFDWSRFFFFYPTLSKLDPIHFLQWFCTLAMSFLLSPFTPIRSICFCSHTFSLTFHTCHLNIPQSRGPGSEQGQSGNEKNYASAQEVLTWLSSRCRWSIHAKIKKILTWNYAHFNLYIATWGSLFHPYLLGFLERKQWGY